MAARVCLCLIFIIGLALRLYHIDNHGMFVDEVYSVLVANGTGDPELLRFDAARPIYFWLLKLWLHFGQSELWLRLLSVIFGQLNILLIYFLARVLTEKNSPSKANIVGLVAALLTALSPMEIHYSQQVRMYTLGSFLALSGCICLVKAFDTERKIYLLGWSLLRLLMVLTLPLTAMLLPVDAAYALFNNRGKGLLKPALFAAVALAILWSPYLVILLQAQASPYDSWRATLDSPDLIDYFTLLVNFTASAIPLQESGGPPLGNLLEAAYCAIFPIVLLIGVADCAPQKQMRWPLAWGLAPLTVLFLWSNIAPPLFITRYTMFTAPFVVLILAAGVAAIHRKNKFIAAAVGLIYFAGISSLVYRFYQNPVHEDWRATADFIASHEKPGDRIIIWNYHSKYLFGYYYHGKNRITDVQASQDFDIPLEKREATLHFEDPPASDSHAWMISREALPGWELMNEGYELYKKAIARDFKVIDHTHLPLTDIYQVVKK